MYVACTHLCLSSYCLGMQTDSNRLKRPQQRDCLVIRLKRPQQVPHPLLLQLPNASVDAAAAAVVVVVVVVDVVVVVVVVAAVVSSRGLF